MPQAANDAQTIAPALKKLRNAESDVLLFKTICVIIIHNARRNEAGGQVINHPTSREAS